MGIKDAASTEVKEAGSLPTHHKQLWVQGGRSATTRQVTLIPFQQALAELQPYITMDFTKLNPEQFEEEISSMLDKLQFAGGDDLTESDKIATAKKALTKIKDQPSRNQNEDAASIKEILLTLGCKEPPPSNCCWPFSLCFNKR